MTQINLNLVIVYSLEDQSSSAHTEKENAEVELCLSATSRGELLNSPRQGSFFTRNSSRAIQPPPTRTITVLRKMRTRRSCWESPNYDGGGEEKKKRRVKTQTCVCVNCPHCKWRVVQHWKSDWCGESNPIQIDWFIAVLCGIMFNQWCVIKSFKNKAFIKDALCPLLISFPCLHKQDFDTTSLFSFHPQRHKLHKGQSNWFLLLLCALVWYTNV